MKQKQSNEVKLKTLQRRWNDLREAALSGDPVEMEIAMSKAESIFDLMVYYRMEVERLKNDI